MDDGLIALSLVSLPTGSLLQTTAISYSQQIFAIAQSITVSIATSHGLGVSEDRLDKSSISPRLKASLSILLSSETKLMIYRLFMPPRCCSSSVLAFKKCPWSSSCGI